MEMQIVSTTDSLEAVNAAKGALADKSIVEKKSVPSSELESEKAEESETSEDSQEESSEETPDESEGDEKESTDDVDEDLEAKNEVEKPKKKGGFQKRIERFQKQLSAKEQELEYWKKEALQAKPAAKVEPKVEAKAEIAGKPKAEDFKSHEEYVEALTDWKLEAREKANEQKAKEVQVKTELQKKGEQFQARIADFKKTASDFDELMEDVTVDVPYYVQEIFLTSENGPALMYELAKNPKELERISKLQPIPAALEMGKLEAKFQKSSPAPKETKMTKAPAPIVPVSAKGGSVKKSIDDPTLSQKEYERLREQQIKAARA